MGRTARGLGAALIVTALGAAVVAGCGDDSAADDGSSTTTEAPSTAVTTELATDPEDDERQAVIAAYQAADEAASAALAPPTPDPEHPDLVATHTGPMLKQRQMVAQGLAANGWAIRLPENSKYRVEVESVEFDPVDPDVAFLTTCAVDDGERFVVETGEIVADGLSTIEFTEAMRRVDGTWRLAERREENRWEGEAGCAVD
jgi:hypothetical protein